MFSFWELIVILVVALLVFKPSELPMLAEKLGKLVRTGKQFVKQVKASIEESPRS